MKKAASPVVVQFIDPLRVNSDVVGKLEGAVKAGFPSPAGDYLEKELNFRELFMRNESSTFFVKVEGTSMERAGILNGDILVVDRSLEPRENSILVCFLDGGFTVKRVAFTDGRLFLMPENPQFQPIPVLDNADLRIWGVVTFAIHQFR